jgi:HSP20 family protein
MFNLFKKKNTAINAGAVDDFYYNNSNSPAGKSNQLNEPWLEEDYEEGQLSVDVYQTDDKIVIQSTIAGVRQEDINITINNDMVTIRGKREIDESVDNKDYFIQECYWGGFSRSIILPAEIQSDKAEAILKNGVLTIILPKMTKAKPISIKIKDEDN